MVVVLLTRLRTHPQNLNSAVKHSLYTLIAVSRAVSLYIAKIASSVHKREIPADPGKTKQGQNWFQVPGNSWHSAANGPTTTLNTDATPPHPSVTMQFFFLSLSSAASPTKLISHLRWSLVILIYLKCKASVYRSIPATCPVGGQWGGWWISADPPGLLWNLLRPWDPSLVLSLADCWHIHSIYSN